MKKNSSQFEKFYRFWLFGYTQFEMIRDVSRRVVVRSLSYTRGVPRTQARKWWPMGVLTVSILGSSIAYNQFYNTIALENATPVTLLNSKEVTRRLRSHEQSLFVNNGKGIIRYDISQLPSNNPIEDNHSEQIIVNPGSANDDCMFYFGIYDGHGGYYTSSKLSESLISAVARQLALKGDADMLDNTIKDAFVQLDNEIVIKPFQNLFKDPNNKSNIQNIMPAISGSCALLSIYDSNTKKLKVAVAGDSRSLIVGYDKDQTNWFVKSCSIDQTGDNPDEVKRIQDEHPKEPNVISRGRILGGLQPTRAFGDYRYKLDSVDGQSLESLPDYLKLYLRNKPKNLLTPPYVTACPEITTNEINENVKFMVMGSDGLYELLTNEEIADIVIKWYNQKNKKPGDLSKPSNIKDYTKKHNSPRDAFRYQSSKPKKPTVLMEDANLATHIIRNALSAGGRNEFVSSLVSIPSPTSRKYRDDLTVTVVFFEDAPAKEGPVLTVNEQATTPVRPKL